MLTWRRCASQSPEDKDDEEDARTRSTGTRTRSLSTGSSGFRSGRRQMSGQSIISAMEKGVAGGCIFANQASLSKSLSKRSGSESSNSTGTSVQVSGRSIPLKCPVSQAVTQAGALQLEAGVELEVEAGAGAGVLGSEGAALERGAVPGNVPACPALTKHLSGRSSHSDVDCLRGLLGGASFTSVASASSTAPGAYGGPAGASWSSVTPDLPRDSSVGNSVDDGASLGVSSGAGSGCCTPTERQVTEVTEVIELQRIPGEEDTSASGAVASDSAPDAVLSAGCLSPEGDGSKPAEAVVASVEAALVGAARGSSSPDAGPMPPLPLHGLLTVTAGAPSSGREPGALRTSRRGSTSGPGQGVVASVGPNPSASTSTNADGLACAVVDGHASDGHGSHLDGHHDGSRDTRGRALSIVSSSGGKAAGRGPGGLAMHRDGLHPKRPLGRVTLPPLAGDDTAPEPGTPLVVAGSPVQGPGAGAGADGHGSAGPVNRPHPPLREPGSTPKDTPQGSPFQALRDAVGSHRGRRSSKVLPVLGQLLTLQDVEGASGHRYSHGSPSVDQLRMTGRSGGRDRDHEDGDGSQTRRGKGGGSVASSTSSSMSSKLYHRAIAADSKVFWDSVALVALCAALVQQLHTSQILVPPPLPPESTARVRDTCTLLRSRRHHAAICCLGMILHGYTAVCICSCGLATTWPCNVCVVCGTVCGTVDRGCSHEIVDPGEVPGRTSVGSGCRVPDGRDSGGCDCGKI